MESKYPDETLRMRGMNLNLCISRMFEDTFSRGLDIVYIFYSFIFSNTGQIYFSKYRITLELEFYGPVNTFKVMSIRSVNLLNFSWACLVL